MRHSGRLLLALAGALVAAPVAAQSAGTVELGAFGRWTKFGQPLTVDLINNGPAESGIGFGGRLGFFFARHLEAEADISTTSVNAAATGKVRYMPTHLGLTYNAPLAEHMHLLLGARYVHNSYGDNANFSDHGFGAVAGLRMGIVRIEGTYDAMTSDGPGHLNYHNLGVNAGLSLLLGNHCNASGDAVTVSPMSSSVERGEKVMFTGTATHCGKPREVAWTATGGTITEHGEYTAGMTPGSFVVTATEPKTGMTSTATVMIKSPPPPPPPPAPAPVVRMTRIDLRPNHSKLKVNESGLFTVSGSMSDGTSHTIDDCALTANGNAVRSGHSFSWPRYGTYSVTANCNGFSDVATVEVPLQIVIYGANFAFNRDVLTAVGMDSVRAAADSLKLYPEIQVRLGGFADFVGTTVYNCDLSWRRARTVHLALNKFGIGDERIIGIEGFGNVYPLPDNEVSAAARALNETTHDKGKWWDRRVDITSATKDGGMMACAEPATAKKKMP